MPTDEIVSEEAIIQGFLAPLAAGFPGAFGLRDDCAVAAPSAGHEFVFKTDAIAEGVHFLSTDHPRDIGWKALAVNVSDLAAKGARPVGYLLSLAFPAPPTRDWMAEFSAGLAEAQAAFGIHLIGGDTDRRPGPISITPMVFGEAPAGRMVRRTTAQAGDIVFVSGTLGDAALGLQLRRQRQLGLRWRLSREHVATLEGRYLRPQPRLALAAVLQAHARAAMDISDGLLKDLGRMCRASGVGARVELAKVRFSPAFDTVRATDPAAAAAAMFAGDDYEILSAVPPDHAAAYHAAAAAAGIGVTAVGQFETGEQLHLLDAQGRQVLIGSSGWDHF